MSQEPDENIMHIQKIENCLMEIERELMQIEANSNQHLVSIVLHLVKHIETESLINLRRALEIALDNQ